MTCPVCHCEFAPETNGRPRKYCGPLCTQEAFVDRRRRALAAETKQLEWITCEICGKPIERMPKNRKHCGDCAALVVREYRRLYAMAVYLVKTKKGRQHAPISND